MAKIISNNYNKKFKIKRPGIHAKSKTLNFITDKDDE